MKTKNSSNKMLPPVMPILCVCEKVRMINKTVHCDTILIHNVRRQHLKVICTTAFSDKSY